MKSDTSITSFLFFFFLLFQPFPSFSSPSSPPLDLTLIIPAFQENSIFLRNCLNSIYRVIESEKNKLELEIIVFEVQSDETEAIPKQYQRRDGIRVAIGNHQRENHNVHLMEAEKIQGWKLSEGMNFAVFNRSRGKFILFLDEKTELLTDFFDPLIQRFKDDPEVGIIGSSLLYSDGTVHHAGINFGLGKCPRDGSDWWFDSTSQSNCPLPYYRYQGRSALDKRVKKETEVDAVTASLIIKRTTYDEVGGVNTQLNDKYLALDLCRKVSSSKKILYLPTSVGFYFGSPIKWNDVENLKLFNNLWGTALEQKIRDNFVFRNVTLVWSMECGKGQVLGFTTEALGFIQALQNKILMKLMINNVHQCLSDMQSLGLSSDLLNSLERLTDVVIEGDVIFVIHRDPGRYNTFVNSLDSHVTPLTIIGRSMYETDKIPSTWVQKCNELVDKIWVPSKFNVDTFSKSGVELNRLVVVPEPTDTFMYDPEIVDSFHLPQKKGFNFVSIGKWEERKGWDILLKAYFLEFTNDDDVALYIRASLDNDNRASYIELRERFMNDTGRSESSLPYIHFIEEKLPFTKLPSLYKAADAFVIATHGEGWGLPIAEAMAMQLPVIATNWSGNTEFMTSNNSYLVPVEKLVKASTSGHHWAQPDIYGIRVNMRSVFENKRQGIEIGMAARQDILNKFSQEKVAEVVLKKIEAILASKEELLRNREGKENTFHPKPKEFKQSGKVTIKIVEDF